MRVGDRWEQVVAESLTRTQIVQYAGASGDFHPLHHDETVAVAAGYPSIFAHGMLTMGLAGRLVEAVAAGKGRLVRYGARMVAQVWPGDTLTATAEVVSVADDVAELAVEVRNQAGAVVLVGGARVRVEAR